MDHYQVNQFQCFGGACMDSAQLRCVPKRRLTREEKEFRPVRGRKLQIQIGLCASPKTEGESIPVTLGIVTKAERFSQLPYPQVRRSRLLVSTERSRSPELGVLDFLPRSGVLGLSELSVPGYLTRWYRVTLTVENALRAGRISRISDQ